MLVNITGTHIQRKAISTDITTAEQKRNIVSSIGMTLAFVGILIRRQTIGAKREERVVIDRECRDRMIVAFYRYEHFPSRCINRERRSV